MTIKKKALGRGLSAILSSPETDITSKDISGEFVVGAVANIPLESIETNPFQPRTHFEEAALRELSDSIESMGVIQPISVRKLGYDKYQLICGERRFRAAVMAGLTEIPAYIRVANDEQMLEMALIENIHREDLNAIEVAISYQRLIEECNLNQEELSDRIGKDRSTVTNYLRLLKLPVEIQVGIREKKISMGHARALVSVADATTQSALFNNIVNKDMSVRQVEELVRNIDQYHPLPKKIIRSTLPQEFENIRERIVQKLNQNVDLKINRKGVGSLVIHFQSEEELNNIVGHIEK